MTDPSAEFFDGLNRRGHEPRLAKVHGTIRFDLQRDHRSEHWLLTITHGGLRVSREASPADCVVRADHPVFDRVVVGDIKPKPAWLRNDVTVEGYFLFYLLLEKLIPAPLEAQPEIRARA